MHTVRARHALFSQLDMASMREIYLPSVSVPSCVSRSDRITNIMTNVHYHWYCYNYYVRMVYRRMATAIRAQGRHGMVGRPNVIAGVTFLDPSVTQAGASFHYQNCNCFLQGRSLGTRLGYYFCVRIWSEGYCQCRLIGTQPPTQNKHPMNVGTYFVYKQLHHIYKRIHTKKASHIKKHLLCANGGELLI